MVEHGYGHVKENKLGNSGLKRKRMVRDVYEDVIFPIQNEPTEQ